jgi:hypothetical protein
VTTNPHRSRRMSSGSQAAYLARWTAACPAESAPPTTNTWRSFIALDSVEAAPSNTPTQRGDLARPVTSAHQPTSPTPRPAGRPCVEGDHRSFHVGSPQILGFGDAAGRAAIGLLMAGWSRRSCAEAMLASSAAEWLLSCTSPGAVSGRLRHWVYARFDLAGQATGQRGRHGRRGDEQAAPGVGARPLPAPPAGGGPQAHGQWPLLGVLVPSAHSWMPIASTDGPTGRASGHHLGVSSMA